MRSEQWAAGGAAAAVLAGLIAALVVPAMRGPDVTRSPAAALQHAPGRGALVCLSQDLICQAPSLPEGFPCACSHPLRGPLAGRVVPMSEAERVIEQVRFLRAPALDSSSLGPR